MIKFILNRKILVGLLTVLVLVVGGYSLTKINEELLPDVSFDGAYVAVSAGDMAAVEVERNITTPIEQSLLAVDGVEDVFSTTGIGHSSLQVMIEKGRGEEVSKEVETIANTVATGVTGVTDVFANQMSMGADYEFFMDISGGDMDEMSLFAEEVLKPRLEELPEVKDASLMGIQEYEMVVEFDRERLSENMLDSTQVIPIIQEESTDATVGEFSGEEGQPVLRWETGISSAEDVAEITIPTQDGPIQLSDIADVTLQPMETSSNVYKEGSKDFIFVQVGRTADVTQVEMAHAVREEIQKIRKDGLIDGFTLNEVVAQADYVEDSISGITNNILIGGMIALIVLLLYLRNVRATLVIAISIPTSLLLTFLMMWLLDYSFNMLTLIALGLGVALMVDSSIVILESIYKKKELGHGARDSVIQGTKEVASAIMASVLTTIVVFLPIGLMGGDVGQFMIMLSVVVAITLISSMLVAFTIIPALSESFLKPRKKNKIGDGRFIKGYETLVSWVVSKKRHSIAIITTFILIFIGSLFLVAKIPMTIMPDMLNRYTELMINLETGLSVEEKNEVVLEISETLEEIDDVESSYIIDDGSIFYLLINMTKGDDITREQKDVNEEILSSLRELSDDFPVQSVQSAMSMNAGQPVQVQIKGEDYEQLQTLAQTVTERMEDIDGLAGITNSIERTSIEKVIELNQENMEEAGVTELELRPFIQQAFLNMPIGEVNSDGNSVPLIVKWDEEVINESELLDLNVLTMEGEERLSSFIDLRNVETPNEISHINGERFVTVSADIEGTDLGSVNREIQSMITDMETPSGYAISAGGDLEIQQELIYDMILIFVISIFLVYLVMAVQFNHLAHPIIIMSVIPMAFVGVIIGLFATQRELSIMSGMGIILLVGIVLNNAILLIDRTNQLRRAGYSPNDAIVQAGKDRIRPIFMTTFTTVGGMLPLALASGTTGNYQGPMATAIISGLLFATLITLVLIPAVYRSFNAIGNGFKKIFKKKDKIEEMTEEKVV